MKLLTRRRANYCIKDSCTEKKLKRKSANTVSRTQIANPKHSSANVERSHPRSSPRNERQCERGNTYEIRLGSRKSKVSHPFLDLGPQRKKSHDEGFQLWHT